MERTTPLFRTGALAPFEASLCGSVLPFSVTCETAKIFSNSGDLLD